MRTDLDSREINWWLIIPTLATITFIVLTILKLAGLFALSWWIIAIFAIPLILFIIAFTIFCLFGNVQ